MIVIIASYYRQLSADMKMKNFKTKTSFCKPEGPKAQTQTNKNFIFRIFILVLVENCL